MLSAFYITFSLVLFDAGNQWVDNHFGEHTFIFLIIGLIVAGYIAYLLCCGDKFCKKYAVGKPTINIKRFGKNITGKHNYFNQNQD
jgi:hypothetical protein